MFTKVSKCSRGVLLARGERYHSDEILNEKDGNSDGRVNRSQTYWKSQYKREI